MLELRPRGGMLEQERVAAAIQEPLEEDLWQVTLHRGRRHLKTIYYPADDGPGAVLWLGNGVGRGACRRLCRSLQAAGVACLCLDRRKTPLGEDPFADALAAARFLTQEGHERFVALALDRQAEEHAIRLLQRCPAAVAAARVKPQHAPGARLLHALKAPSARRSDGAAFRLARLPASAGRGEPVEHRVTDWVLEHLEGAL